MAKSASVVSVAIAKSRSDKLGHTKFGYSQESLKPVTKKGNITMAQADRAVREVLATQNK